MSTKTLSPLFGGARRTPELLPSFGASLLVHAAVTYLRGDELERRPRRQTEGPYR